jgi:hypothetical protein
MESHNALTELPLAALGDMIIKHEIDRIGPT